MKIANVTQLVECIPCKDEAASSSLAVSSKTCTVCGLPLKAGKSFCSSSCHKQSQQNFYVSQWKLGLLSGSKGERLQVTLWLRKYLWETRGTACQKCGWDERHPVDGKVLTEVNHIDGDASNNSEENLEIICPNCHSMTETFRARNKNSKRNRS
jgi:5-methylcytosine-specific restriction endonuclease McrA